MNYKTMKSAIWKLHLDIQDATILHLPSCAEFLNVSAQNEQLILWARVLDVDNLGPKVSYRVITVCNGQPCNHTICMTYVGTAMLETNDFHVFVERA